MIARELLGFLPSNNSEEPPQRALVDDPERKDKALKTLVPANPNQPYDVRDVIKAVVDDRHFFEVQSYVVP